MINFESKSLTHRDTQAIRTAFEYDDNLLTDKWCIPIECVFNYTLSSGPGDGSPSFYVLA